MVSYEKWPTTMLDALPLGCDNEGNICYCAVAFTNNGDHIPGKAKGNTCKYPYHGEEVTTENFAYVKIAGAMMTQMSDGSGPPQNALMDGHERQRTGEVVPYYAAIAITQWGMVPGKANSATCQYSYEGREHIAGNFAWVIVGERVRYEFNAT